MDDASDIDQALGSLLDEVLVSVYQVKQAAWAASGSLAEKALHELLTFLIDGSHVLMEAEEQVDGRASGLSTPSAHQRGNLMAEAHGELASAVTLLVDHLGAVVGDIRDAVGALGDAPQARPLVALADGLAARVQAIQDTVVPALRRIASR